MYYLFYIIDIISNRYYKINLKQLITSKIFETIKKNLYDISIINNNNTLAKINSLNLDATNISAYASALQGLNKRQAELVLSRKNLTFLVIFCSIANLFLDGMTLSDENGLSKKFNNLGNNELLEITNKSKVVWNKEVRNRLIKRVKNVIKPYFSYAPRSNNDYNQWNIKMINFLEKAYTEEQMYDFKIGITNFKTGTFNKECISKIVETLAAMANTKPNKEGYILLGIPNDDDDAISISSKLHTNLEYCRNYKILGIEDEANTYYKDIDSYLKRIKETIENEPISNTFKNELLTKCHPIEYKDKLLYLFVCKSDEPVYYDKKLYVRYGSHNHKVEFASDEFSTVMKKFYDSSKNGIQ